MKILDVGKCAGEMYMFLCKQVLIMWQLQGFCTDEKISDKNRNSYAQSARNLNKSYCNDSDYKAESRIIISTKPAVKPSVGILLWGSVWASGINSSTTTYIIAPAAKAKR